MIRVTRNGLTIGTFASDACRFRIENDRLHIYKIVLEGDFTTQKTLAIYSVWDYVREEEDSVQP